jgi:hypothetical protein
VTLKTHAFRCVGFIFSSFNPKANGSTFMSCCNRFRNSSKPVGHLLTEEWNYLFFGLVSVLNRYSRHKVTENICDVVRNAVF